MAHFNIHFFKERTREIDPDRLIAYFDGIEGMTVEMDENSVRFNFLHPRLKYRARFLLTPKTHVPDIYRLNPKFLDINFHLEIPILTPDYFANYLFELVKKVSATFNLHIYNEMLEDVQPFRLETLKKVFRLVKDAYMEKNPILLSDYCVLSKDRLQSILRYQDDQYDLQKYYKELGTYVPMYHFVRQDQGDVRIAVEWKEQTLTVFPPHLDMLLYRQNDQIKVIDYGEIKNLIDKYLEDVPGFIKGTRVLPRKNMKKVHKIARKADHVLLDKSFQECKIDCLID